LPRGVPAAKTQARRFDEMILEAFEPIEARWHAKLTELDVIVEEVPTVPVFGPDGPTWDENTVTDRDVPLSQLFPSSSTTPRARLVFYRRALESRTKQPDELTELVRQILIEQVSNYLNVEPEVVEGKEG
jgi:predicted Zn-dependent protease with MMP-like domain